MSAALAGGAALMCACAMASSAPISVSTALTTSPVQAAALRPPPAPRCLPDGSGYLRAQLRGAIDADLDWHGAGVECEGGMRPDEHGIRVSFAGPLRAHGAAHRLRFIFGIAAAGEGRPGRAVPANITLIVEGEQRVFSTRGDDKCTVDRLDQQPIASAGRSRDYRITARGFCVGPASRLGSGASRTGADHVLVSRFDFSGRISLYTDAHGAVAGEAGPDHSYSRRPIP